MHTRKTNLFKERFLDNIFTERLWRALKYECVYLHAWQIGTEAKAGIRKGVIVRTHQPPHSSLGGRPPAVVYELRNETNNLDQQVHRGA